MKIPIQVIQYIRIQLVEQVLNYQDKDKADKVSTVTLHISASAFTLGDVEQKILRLLLTLFRKMQSTSGGEKKRYKSKSTNPYKQAQNETLNPMSEKSKRVSQRC